jgi:hypothetical protein
MQPQHTCAMHLLQVHYNDQLVQYRAVLREELKLLSNQVSACGLNMLPAPPTYP